MLPITRSQWAFIRGDCGGLCLVIGGTKGDGRRWHGVRDVNELVGVVFSGLPALVIEDV